jgi:hypothetical protein
MIEMFALNQHGISPIPATGRKRASDAQGDEILIHIIAQAAPRLNVMDLKIFRASARLASPAISL